MEKKKRKKKGAGDKVSVQKCRIDYTDKRKGKSKKSYVVMVVVNAAKERAYIFSLPLHTQSEGFLWNNNGWKIWERNICHQISPRSCIYFNKSLDLCND